MNPSFIRNNPLWELDKTVHRGSHKNYTKSVKRCLNKIPQSMSIGATCKMVNKVQKKFKNELLSNTKPLHGENVPYPWSSCPRFFK